MLNFTEVQSALSSNNISLILKTVTDIRERIEIVHTSEFGLFLQNIFPNLRDLITSHILPQFIDNNENKCRHTILEIFNRFPSSDVLKPYILDLMNLSMKVFSEDNEDNALTALRVIFDLHKSFRPSLESHVQPFLDLVQRLFKNIPTSSRTIFQDHGPSAVRLSGIQDILRSKESNSKLADSEERLLSVPESQSHTSPDSMSTFKMEESQFFENGQSTLDQDKTQASQVSSSLEMPLLKSLESFKVLTECPLIIMLLFQVYPKFISRNIPAILPHMMTVLSLTLPIHAAQVHKIRFREFLASQVKTLSLITYFLRDFSELMHSYEDVVAKNVHSLIQSCPLESVSTRKELLVDFRHILATDFRRGFTPYLDSFLDENFLMGPGRYASETLRPLVFLTIADVVHHTRDNLNFSQLSRVVFLFSKNLHDPELSAAIQTTSVRILVSITERFATTHYDQAATYQRDRKLMNRMIRLLSLKFASLKEYIPIVELNQARQSYLETENIGDYCGRHSSLLERLEAELIPSDNKLNTTSSRNDIYISVNKCNQDKLLYSNNQPQDSLRDIRHLMKASLAGMKAMLTTLFSMHKSFASSIPGTVSSAQILGDDEVEIIKLFVAWTLEAVYLISERPIPSKDLFSDPSAKTNGGEIAFRKIQRGSSVTEHDIVNNPDTANESLQPSSSQDFEQDIKTFLEQLMNIFVVLSQASLIRTILSSNLEYLLQLTQSKPIFVSLIHYLLTVNSPKCSQMTMDCVINFIMTRLPALSTEEESSQSRSSSYSSAILRLLKVAVGVISGNPDNERVLRTKLKGLLLTSFRLARESRSTINYIHIFRTLFRSLTGGKFEQSFKEIGSVLSEVVAGFDMLLERNHQNLTTRCAIYELYFTIPCRFDSLLPHFVRLLEIFVEAIQEKSIESLTSIALRTMDQWIDNMNHDYFFGLLQSRPGLGSKIFSGICLHLKPPPYPYGALALRILGKFGGKSRLFFGDQLSTSLGSASVSSDVELECSSQSRFVLKIDGAGSGTEASLESSAEFTLSLNPLISEAAATLESLLPYSSTNTSDVLSLLIPSNYSFEKINCELNIANFQPTSLQADIANILKGSALFSTADVKLDGSSLDAEMISKQILEETNYCEKSVYSDQLQSAFDLVSSAIISGLPLCSSSVSGAQITLNLKVAKIKFDNFKPSLIWFELFNGLLCSACYGSLLPKARNFLAGISQHLAVLTIQGDLSYQPLLSSFYRSILKACQSYRWDVYAVGIKALKQWSSFLFELLDLSPEIETQDILTPLMHSIYLSCSEGTSWNERMGGVRVIYHLSTTFPPSILRLYEVTILRSLFAVIGYAQPNRYSVVLEDVLLALESCITTVYSGNHQHTMNQHLLTFFFRSLQDSRVLIRIASQYSLSLLAKALYNNRVTDMFLENELKEEVSLCLSTSSSQLANVSNIGYISRIRYLTKHLIATPLLPILDIFNYMKLLFQYYDDTLFNGNIGMNTLLKTEEIRKTSCLSPVLLEICKCENYDIIFLLIPISISEKIEIILQIISLIQAAITYSDIMNEKHITFRIECFQFLYNCLLYLNWEDIIIACGNVMSDIVQVHLQYYSNQTNELVNFDPLGIFNLSEKIKIFLTLFDHPRHMTLDKLKKLEVLLKLCKNRNYIKVGYKLLEHLKFWVEPEKVIQLNIWPAGEEIYVAAAMMNIFSILPWNSPMPSENSQNDDQSNQMQLLPFIRRYVEVLVKLNRVLCQYRSFPSQQSPYLTPLSRFMTAYPQEWMIYFTDPFTLAKNDIIFLLYDIFDSPDLFPQFLSFYSKAGVIATEKCIGAYCFQISKRAASLPTLYSSSIREAFSSFEASHRLTHSNALYSDSDINFTEFSSDLPTFTDEMLTRVTTNSLKIILRIIKYNANSIQPRSNLLTFIRILLSINLETNGFSIQQGYRNIMTSENSGTKQSSYHGESINNASNGDVPDVIDDQLHSHFDLRILCNILLTYCRANKDDVFALFDLIPVLCIPSTIDTSFITNFFRGELPYLYSTEDKRVIVTIFLAMIKQRDICATVQVKSIQVVITPIFLSILRDRNPLEKKDIFNSNTLELIMRYAFTSSDKPESSEVSDLVKVELLKLATMLIEYCSLELVDHRKDLIKFAWNQLKSEEPTTKHWAYSSICSFISAYETPPKIILQVYVALLRTCHIEYKDLVQYSLDTLVPALPKRLRSDDFIKAMKWTKKVVFEEGHTLPQLIHVWNIIVRHASIFYPFRSHFVPQMVSSISRLGIPANSPLEHRQVALGCVEALIGWEHTRLKKVEYRLRNRADSSSETITHSVQSEKEEDFSLHPSMIQMIGNFLVRLGLFTADHKDISLSKLCDKCVQLYQTLVRTVSMSNVKINYFERLFKTFLENYYTSLQNKAKSQNKDAIKSEEDQSIKGRAANNGTPQKTPKSSDSASEISERILLTLIQFLLVSMDNNEVTSNLVYENIGLLKELLTPLIHSDYIAKSQFNIQFRKLIIKIFVTFPPISTLTSSFVDSGFYNQLSILLDKLLRTEYGEFSVTSKRSDQKSSQPPREARKSKSEPAGVPWNHLWALQLLDEICMSTNSPSWIENVGGGVVSLCRQFLKRHLSTSQISRANSANLERKNMIPVLSNSKLSSIAGLINPSPTPHILLALDAQRNILNDSTSNQTIQPDELISALVYCVNILCNSLYKGFLLEHRQFILSSLHSILQLSDSPILWNLSIRYSCSWLIDRRTPLSSHEQVELFRCFVNLEKWSMEIQSHGTMLRLIALIEQIASHLNENHQDFKRLYPLRSEIPTAISLSAYSLLSTNSQLRNISIERFFRNNDLNIRASSITKFLHLMKMNWKHVENRYWLSCIPSIFLAGIHESQLKVISLKDIIGSSEISSNVSCVLPSSNSYYSFVTEFQNQRESSIIQSLCNLSFLNPAISDSIWQECLNMSWQSSSKSIRQLVCHELCCNLARHDYLNLSWPSHPTYQNNSLPTSIPSKLVHTFLSFFPEPDFPSEFLGAVGAAYGFWHDSCEKITKDLNSKSLTRAEIEHEVKIIIATLMDLGDLDSVRTVYSNYCQFPYTKKILSLESYGNYSEAQETVLQAFKYWPNMLTDKNFDYEPLDLAIWEDRWLDSAKQLSQWNIISEFSESCQLPSLGMEAASMKCDWSSVRKFRSLPEIAVQYERNNCLLKLFEAQSHIVDQKLNLAEKCYNSAIHMALLQWSKLPPIQSAYGIRCASSTPKNLLHFFHQIVEIRDSITMMNEIGTKSSKEKTLPDFKSNLVTWRERLPDSSDNFIKWEHILQWRTQFFQTIKSMYQTITDETQLASLHDNPWTIISLSKQARKHNLKDLSVSILSRLQNVTTMDIFDAYSKLREEIMSKFEIDANVDSNQSYFHGINIINSTNLEYFSPQQKAELIRLKALLQMKLNLCTESKQTLSQCVQMCPNYSKSWITWGDFYYSEYYRNVTTNSSNILSNIQIIEDGQCIISCILKGIESNSDIGRIQLSRILLLLMSHDENTGFVLTRYLVQESKHLPIWIWIPFVPLLLHLLQMRQREFIFEIIKELTMNYPQFLGHLALISADLTHLDQMKQLIKLNNETLYSDLHYFYGEIELLFKPYHSLVIILTYFDNLFRDLIDNSSLSVSSPLPPDIKINILQFLRSCEDIPESLLTSLTNDFSFCSQSDSDFTRYQLLKLLQSWIERLQDEILNFESLGNKFRWHTDSRSWYNHLSCDKALSVRSVIEIPGFYQQHATLFSEPKLERHTRLLRVLPNFKPRLGYGKPVSFELLLLGEDGQIYPFEVFERISTEPFYQENLMDSLFGSMEWIFQRQNYSKRCDISLQYSPQILSTSKYKLNFLCGKFKSLEEITTLGKTSSELLKWKGREQELNNGGISTRYEAKKALYIEAKNSTNQSLCIKEQFRKNVHKAPFSSEYFFSLRRIFASQVGITFLVSYFLNLPLPTPRDFVVSLENGSIPLQHKAMRVNFTEQPPYRLSPCVMAAMNSIDTCKIFMGNTALALEERKELIQGFLDILILETLSKSETDVDRLRVNAGALTNNLMTRLSVMCPKGVLSPNLVENSMDPVDLDLERLISQCDPTVLTDWDLTLMPWV